MFLRLAYFQLLYFLIPVFLLVFIYRVFIYKYPQYRFPLADSLKKTNFVKSFLHRNVFLSLRSLVLIGLMLLATRPQWVDPTTSVNVNGVDIIIALDVSGSMDVVESNNDRRSRLEIAKAEALRFIDKRTNDPIGLVLFGGEVISRCPSTLDKQILRDIIAGLKLGYISPNSTMLGTGLASAINRLRNSKAKSRIVILLTDGVPNSDTIAPDIAVEIAKKLDVKVYTIGIGGNKSISMKDPFGRLLGHIPPVDMKLLDKIAKDTDGKSFRASSSQDMRRIYDEIDSLEKTKIETSVFHNYHEAIDTFILFVLLLFFLEVVLKLFIWRGVSC